MVSGNDGSCHTSRDITQDVLALSCKPEDCCKADISGRPNCAAAMAAQSSAAPAVASTTATKEGEEDNARLPTLKAAAVNPEGPFTSAAAEAGCEEGEGTVPAQGSN